MRMPRNVKGKDADSGVNRNLQQGPDSRLNCWALSVIENRLGSGSMNMKVET